MPYILFLLLIFAAEAVPAHKSSDSYLTIDIEQHEIFLRWDIALRDLQNVIDLDFDSDGQIQWWELKKKQVDVFAYSLARLHLQSNALECSIKPDDIKVNQRSDGFYAVLYAQGLCANTIDALTIDYQLFFEVDAQHRGLTKISSNNSDISFAFSSDTNKKTFHLNKNYTSDTFFRFVAEGIWHIWIGYDHLFFLLSLLLPAVLIRYQKDWHGIENFSKALLDVIKIVTAFTLAHSITLSMVMLSKISLPVMLVESIIAFSVLVAALNNLYPLVSHKRWLLGFIFGLIHGFGFANVLVELQLSQYSLFASLLGFNIGVELGQLAIVLIFMPVAYFLRNGWLYQNIIYKLGSASIASLGFIWMVERSL